MPKKRPPNAEATEFRAGEQQVEIARQGGVASGIARREKKTVQKILNDFALALGVDKLQYHIDRLLLGILNKSTSIHHHCFAVHSRRVVLHSVAVGGKLAHKMLAIDQIFRASQRNYIYLISTHLITENNIWLDGSITTSYYASVPCVF